MSKSDHHPLFDPKNSRHEEFFKIGKILEVARVIQQHSLEDKKIYFKTDTKGVPVLYSKDKAASRLIEELYAFSKLTDEELLDEYQRSSTSVSTKTDRQWGLTTLLSTRLSLHFNPKLIDRVCREVEEFIQMRGYPPNVIRNYLACLTENLGRNSEAIRFSSQAGRKHPLKGLPTVSFPTKLFGSFFNALGHQAQVLDIHLKTRHYLTSSFEVPRLSVDLDWAANQALVLMYEKETIKHENDFSTNLLNGQFALPEDTLYFDEGLFFHNTAQSIANFTMCSGRRENKASRILDEVILESSNVIDVDIPTAVRSRPLVTIYLRSPHYKREPFDDNTITYFSYRNSNVEDFLSGITALIERGYSVVRMGATGQERISIDSPYFWDYANNPKKLPLIDLILFQRSAFSICGTGGAVNLALLFDKPVLWVDYPPTISNHIYHPLSRVLYRPTLYDGKPASLNLFNSFPFDGLFNGVTLAQLGLVFLSNTQAQNKDAILSFEEMVRNTNAQSAVIAESVANAIRTMPYSYGLRNKQL